ncbi:hypothetical protein ACFYSJ_38370 [Streptomyces sp. NPDC005248]|uniref:hypothetical protein n=1 Tax=Streptomyces sp. NPDC005248 TaxID=3364709 RepID=UPI0036B69074
MLTLQDSTVGDNTATNGGGINNVGTAKLFRSTVKDNHAVQTGSGIFNNSGGSVTLDHSAVLGTGQFTVRAAASTTRPAVR